ncbi:MAG: hypothetical protein KA319_10590 [Ferruginibacter sp.]|nr:hypothetical protein [Ferruginibacter sp.]
MKIIIILAISLISISFFSCKKENVENGITLSQTDYLVFGHFYGECIGSNCISIYRLESNQILEDTNDKYPNSTNFYDANYIRLSQQKFNDVKDLINDFPMDLLNETNNVIGQPDAGDWGGLYIEYNYNGVKKFWLLDQMKSNVPTEYHNFIDKVNAKIKLIQ